jgi:hypothetical protein
MPFNEAGLPREVAQFVSPVSPMTDDEAVAAGRERERARVEIISPPQILVPSGFTP